MALKRIIIAVIFVPCILFIAREGRIYFLILVDVIVAGAVWEFYRMVEKSVSNPYKLIGTAGAVLLPVLLYYRMDNYIHLVLTAIIIGIIVTELCRRGRKFYVYNISVTLFGVFYVGWLGSHILLIREIPVSMVGSGYREGFNFVTMLFLLTWSYDTGAYMVGRLIGKRKLFPRISPGKTLEGTIGGVLLAVAGILVARVYIFRFLEIWEAVALALIISAAGQTGDLVESMIKRDMNRKDSSNTIPGHGGMLDRFDSMLFAAPVLYYILIFFLLVR